MSKKLVIINNIQYLRAIAALSVVIYHCSIKIDKIAIFHHQPLPSIRFDGNIGVDIFFIISGFIMFHCYHQGFSQSGSAINFLIKRLLRIVPLYWFFTLIELAFRYGGTSKGAGITITDIMGSLFFIPLQLAHGRVMPLMDIGWTLYYEIFFYLVFSIALLLPQRLGLGLIAMVMAFSILLGEYFSQYTGVQFISRPIILQFLIGVFIGVFYQKYKIQIKKLSRFKMLRFPLIITLLIIASYSLVFNLLSLNINRETGLGWRPINWLIAASIVVIALLSSGDEQQLTKTGWGHRFWKKMGDCSYSLYLSHPFVLTILHQLWMKFIPNYPALMPIFFIMAIASSLIGGIIVHQYIEKPLLKLVSVYGQWRRPSLSMKLTRHSHQ
ncbi:MAG: acyltransferase family protein [Alphaproteobacteria bacterium]